MGANRDTNSSAERFLDGVIASFVYAQHPRYIFKLRTTGTHTVTVIGTFPERLYEGFRIKGTFRQQQHERYGTQYAPVRVEVASATDPQYRLGVIDLLSRHLHGVGPKTAAAIVDRYDREVFAALEEPERLKEIPGVSEKKAVAIADAWRRSRKEVEHLLPFYELGLSPTQTDLVIQTFGEERAPQVVRDNVYELTRVPGIGFRTADRIAQTVLGYKPDDPRRLAAAARHIVWTALGYGDTAPSLESIERIAQRQLDLTQDQIHTGLELAIERNQLVTHEGRLGLPYVFEVERDLYETLRLLQNTPVRKLLGFEPEQDANLSPAQRVIFEAVANHVVVRLTGLPGTGKTYTVERLARALQRRGLRVLGLAPTGKAALRMRMGSDLEAHTVHKALGFIPETARWPEPPDPTPNVLDYDVVIVDESSMLDVFMMRAVLRSVVPGKTRLIFVGDPNQLPPVGPGEPFAQLLEHLPGAHLTEVFRQAADNPIVAAAHAIAAGERPRASGDERLELELGAEEELTMERAIGAYSKLWKRAQVRPQILVPGNRGPLGVLALNRRIKELVNPGSEHLEALIGGEAYVHVGDPVIVTRNNYKKGVMNGEQGIVVEVGMNDQGEKILAVDFAGQIVVFDQREEFFHLLPAYAISVHRSQGSQWPAVMVVLTTAHYTLLNRESIYTALTRAENHALVFGSRKALSVALKREAGQRSTWLSLFLKGGIQA